MVNIINNLDQNDDQEMNYDMTHDRQLHYHQEEMELFAIRYAEEFATANGAIPVESEPVSEPVNEPVNEPVSEPEVNL